MDKISVEDYDLLFGEVRVLKGMFIQLRDIVEGSIASNNLHSNAVKTSNIKDGAITTDKITALSIDASKIAVGTITSDQIKDGTIAADKIMTGTLTGLQISSGTITAGLLKTGGQAFSHNLVFSSTDADTVAWTEGTLTTADGTDYAIVAGNTGDMTARTYIYLDKGVSETVLQISTLYDAPLGDEKIPIATAENSTNNAVFQVFAGGGGVFISGGMIAAHTIGATQITAGAITATEITVSNLNSLSATMGALSAGTITGARINVGGGTDEDIYFADSGIRMYDAVSGVLKRVYWKYEAVNFARLSYKSDTTSSWFYLTSGAYSIYISQQSSTGVLRASGHRLELGAGNTEVKFFNTGQFTLDSVSSAPTENNYGGGIMIDQYGELKIYTTAWRHIASSSGW